MSQFVLLLYDDPAFWRTMPPADLQAAFGKYMAWTKKVRQDGFCIGSNKLADNPGKVVRGPKPLATDGPYSETKEVLGGLFVIEAANYEEAVQRCLNHPHLEFGGTIEVRQVEVLPS